MKLLAVDVSSSSKEAKNGVAFWNGKKFSYTEAFPYFTPSHYYTFILEIVKKYKPEAIIYADSHSRFNIIRQHARLHGYLDLVADEMDIYSLNINEKHARSVVLGNGKASKQDTMDYFKEENEDIADAKLLIECYNKEYTAELTEL